MRRYSAFPGREGQNIKAWYDAVRKAVREFLALPTLIISMFLALAIGVYIFERSPVTLYSPLRDFLEARIFANATSTSDLLSTIAGSIITVTSITTTLLLLIVQQTASTMTSQVFDQYLRRRSNQLFFGFFIGLALYTLITLASVDEPFNPVFAAALAFVLTVIALYLLILLFYSTIHQMRPTVIIQAIHDQVLDARKQQIELMHHTRREPILEAPASLDVKADYYGFVTRINLSEMGEFIQDSGAAHEVILKVSVGSFVAYRDLLAVVKSSSEEEAGALGHIVRRAINLERSRDIERDSSYGIEQLEIIAWSSTSPAKGNPGPGLQTVYSLRDILARWSEDEKNNDNDNPLPIVYNDSLIHDLIGAFESLAVAASTSRLHQILREIFDAFSSQYPSLPEGWQALMEESIMHILPTMSSHILTIDLEAALSRLIEVLEEAEKKDLVDRLKKALESSRWQIGRSEMTPD